MFLTNRGWSGEEVSSLKLTACTESTRRSSGRKMSTFNSSVALMRSHRPEALADTADTADKADTAGTAAESSRTGTAGTADRVDTAGKAGTTDQPTRTDT